MAAEIFYDDDADLSIIQGRTVAVLAPLGIKEMAQSGTVALSRGPRSMSGAGTLRPVERTA